MMFCRAKSTDQQSQDQSTNRSINDTPISNVKDDKLGFGEMAKHLARAFYKNDLSNGFVIGVEGVWGSGKSSLVNLAIKKLPGGEERMVRFSPWLIGKREVLLQQFFVALGSKLDNKSERKTRRLMKIYAKAASGAVLITEIAGIFIGSPLLANLIGWLLKASLGWLFKLIGLQALERSDLSLDDLKDRLKKNLKELNKPIFVFIDDLDRLEPGEVVEVLRLVRAVADFPNIGYILAYDPENLATCLKRSIKIDDGRAFLEKIVQASFRVPNAQSFDLRNWLSSEFEALLEGEKLDSDKEHRVSSVLNGWAGRCLATPRDVVRTVNSLRLNFVPVRGRVDPGDALFLQLIHVKNDQLFRWIQRYVEFLSMFADGRKISAGTRERMDSELLKISSEKNDEDRSAFLNHLKEHLPGTNLLPTSHGLEFSVFSDLEKDDLQHYSRDCRLASPSHFSLYFSFTHTSGHLSDEEIAWFLERVVDDKDNAAAKFAAWAKQSRPQGRQMGEVVLDRLVELSHTITPEQIKGLFEVLGRTMDGLARNSSPPFDYPYFLSGGRRQVFGLIVGLPNAQRMQTLERLFKTAPSLAWLVGIMRSNAQINSGKAFVAEDAILTEDEFAVLSREFSDRLAHEEPKKLLETPYFLELMYGWIQVGDTARCLDWVENITSTEYGFLVVLKKMTTWSSSSDSGVQYRIQLKTLVDFFGSFEEPIERLKAIANNAKDNNLQKCANEVLTIIESK